MKSFVGQATSEKKNSSSNNNKTSFTFQRHSISTKFMRGTFLTGRGKMKVQDRIRTKYPWSFQVSVILQNESKLSSVHFFSQLLAVTLFYVFIFYIYNCYFWALKREWNISSFLFGKERGNDVISIGRAVLAEFFFCTGRDLSVLEEFFMYWPIFFNILPEFVIHMMRANFAIQMLY